MTRLTLLKCKVVKWNCVASTDTLKCLRNTVDFPSKQITISAVMRWQLIMSYAKIGKTYWALAERKTGVTQPVDNTKVRLDGWRLASILFLCTCEPQTSVIPSHL